jgi:hypothetical protein
MMKDTKVPTTFWPEAVSWTTYILNRSPTVANKDKTPQELWTGNPPSVEHFKVFGCVAFVHVPDQQRKKLDDKSWRGFFLGMSQESKAYRLYNPNTKKVVVSRDVSFDEQKGWDSEPESSSSSTTLIWEGCIDEDCDSDADDSEEESNQNPTNEAEDHLVQNEPNVTATDLEPRQRRLPSYLEDYDLSFSQTDLCAMLASAEDPLIFEDAVKEEKWRIAMKQEIQAIEKNNTWRLTELPSGVKQIGVKWLFKTKLKKNGSVDKYKTRLVVKGYAQKEGIDYTEVFAPVARWDTIRVFLAFAAYHGYPVCQLDVKSAFLYGELAEDVYVEQPQGFVVAGEESKVYKLKKALYGLKQAPRAWYSRIEKYFLKAGFERCTYEHTLFIKRKGAHVLLVSVYVDDVMYTSNTTSLLEEFKSSMNAEFEMTDLGKMRYFLGVEVFQSKEGIFISQQMYAKEILERFQLLDCNFVHNPMVPGVKLSVKGDGISVDATQYKQLIGCLLYITATRPDIMYTVCLLSRYMQAPTRQHMLAAKRVLRYLKGTLTYGIWYKKNAGNECLLGYTDSDYAGDVDDRKSTSGYVFFLAGRAISRASKKQPVVTLSTTEAEFVAASQCATQCVWLKRILEVMGWTSSVKEGTKIWCDNSSTIKLSKNPVLHGRSKHIDVRFHFLRDLVRDGIIELEHCGTHEQVADVMTKAVKLDIFQRLRGKLGMRDLTEFNHEEVN